MPLSDFARRHLDGAINHDGAAKEIADAIDSGGGGGVTLPVTVAQDAFNNTQLIGTDMPNLVGDLENGTGYDNIAVGLESYDNFGNFDANPYVPDPTHYALAAVTTGATNVAIGPSALMAVTTGSGNIAIGSAVAIAMTTGSNNVIVGSYSGLALTTGQKNVLIGAGAGQSLTTGSANFIFGQAADAAAADTTGAIAIGTNAIAATGQCVLGNPSVGGTYPLALGFGGDTAPADADIQNGQGFLYWDFSGSQVVLKFKGKAADGTVISKTVSTV